MPYAVNFQCLFLSSKKLLVIVDAVGQPQLLFCRKVFSLYNSFYSFWHSRGCCFAKAAKPMRNSTVKAMPFFASHRLVRCRATRVISACKHSLWFLYERQSRRGQRGPAAFLKRTSRGRGAAHSPGTSPPSFRLAAEQAGKVTPVAQHGGKLHLIPARPPNRAAAAF